MYHQLQFKFYRHLRGVITGQTTYAELLTTTTMSLVYQHSYSKAEHIRMPLTKGHPILFLKGQQKKLVDERAMRASGRKKGKRNGRVSSQLRKREVEEKAVETSSTKGMEKGGPILHGQELSHVQGGILCTK